MAIPKEVNKFFIFLTGSHYLFQSISLCIIYERPYQRRVLESWIIIKSCTLNVIILKTLKYNFLTHFSRIGVLGLQSFDRPE